MSIREHRSNQTAASWLREGAAGVALGSLLALLPSLAAAAELDLAQAREAAAAAREATPPINDQDPSSSVPNKAGLNRDPLRAGLLIMELSSRAEAAEREQKFEEALKYYAAIAKAVPDRALPQSKMCEINVNLGHPEDARTACRRATELEGAKLADHLHYASVLLGDVPPGAGDGRPVPPEDVAELDATFQHLQNQNVNAIEVDYLACQLALKLEDPARLRRCVEQLVQKAPGDPVTLSHQFSLALLEKNYSDARAVIGQARERALPPEALKLMEDEVDTRSGRKSMVRAAEGVGVVALLAACAWFGRGLWRRRRAPATAG